MKRKIDKTLKEVRRWKREVGAKLRRMTTAEAIAYLHSAKKDIPPSKKRRAA